MKLEFLAIKKLDNKKRVIITNLVIFILVCGGSYAIITPCMADISKIKNEILGQYTAMEKKYQSAMKSRNTIETIKKIEPQIATIDQMFIPKNEQLQFITSLENSAASSSLKAVISLKSDSKANSDKVLFSITSEGVYRQQIKFLRHLEKMNYQINVTKLDFIRSGGVVTPSDVNSNFDSNNVTMNLDIETFWK
ncbi:MAG: hypothetical protein WCK11_01105 [Candidatus Falkowbacteria bacterium]